MSDCRFGVSPVNYPDPDVCLGARAPYCGCVFDLRADQCLVCSCADWFVFSLDVPFQEI